MTSWMHPRFQTRASHWLRHSAKKGQRGCQSDKDYVWCRLLDRSQVCCQQTHPAHSACTTTPRQESSKDIWCLQAETRLQEESVRQWYLDALQHSSEDVDECWTIQRHRSLFSNRFPRTSISQTPRLVWWEWQRNPKTPWKETLKNTRHTSVFNKTAYSNICKTVQTKLRDTRLLAEQKGWWKERIWRSYLMHLRQYMVPRAQEPPHSLVRNLSSDW